MLDDGLTEITDTPGDAVDPETVNSVFRAVHSIKGGAAAFGLDALVKFAHQFETALDEMRSGRLSATDAVMKILLRSADHLSALVVVARDNTEINTSVGADLLEKLAQISGSSVAAQSSAVAGGPAEEPDFGFQPLALAFDFGPAAESTFTIVFSATKRLFANGNDPVHLFRALAELGSLSVKVDTDALPRLDDLDCADSYFTWLLILRTSDSEEAIREVFEFVDGACSLEITREEGAEDITTKPSEPQIVDVGRAPEVVDTAATPQPDSAGARQDSPPSPPPSRSRGGAGSDKPTKAAAGFQGTVRVDLELVDRLINIVGELVINQAVLSQCVQDAGLSKSPDVISGLDEFKNLAREIQENVMAIRAQSVKPLFQRMARILREASDISGKVVRFETEGEATEVDKTVIERLVDPLTHIIRNSVDHGLELAEVRRAAGKPETGRVKLSAAHRSGRVLIEVSDDGGGINRPKVRQIAIDKGLIPPESALSDNEIDKLLFLPGFSTAREVTDLSGRGVGMDVVRSSIHNLGGRVNIASVPGQGTTLSISLPLTLAVLDGMVVDVAGQTMVIPITAIIETLRPSAKDIHQVASNGQVVAVRDTFVPIVDLAEVFGHRKRSDDYTSMVLLLVESGQNERWALAVDRIHDQRQVVIKGLEGNYGHVPGVAAATILGDGKIALIIDPEEAALRVRAESVSPSMMRLEEL
ncbi:two-component system, chemotaxis family, sensor kinase CheA [Roseicitreum antarcticum]|uniref:Chemotaxis protein CheA n=2 Tax=Roseicitreum antarcticum TaxID=564137 RepID=A0A1H3ATV4_9RHOB|nr:two-component system, chemotaxis family, sensor kinase CheA [Roseicitreum antarcticum]